MVPFPPTLFSLTAVDLMSAPLITIPEDMSLRGAAHRLVQAAVTGAPVVNSEGRCVGVLSTTDFMHWMDREHLPNPAACAASSAFCFPWEMIDPEHLPDDAVHDWMTRDPVMVGVNSPLVDVARKMIDARIHRVIVADASRRPLGVVSSTDVLAALVRSAPAFSRASNDACPEQKHEPSYAAGD
jgi:predicted transcriptional regulator